ncbi:Uncharacterised protein [Mycoplasma putrefaciens]|nr:Uncharacterised protein [Mycoplasma putrefaciens]
MYGAFPVIPLTSFVAIFLSNDSASLNIFSKLSTFEIFQFSMLPLNALAPKNILARDVIFDVSQAIYFFFPTIACLVLIFWLNALAFLNNSKISATLEIFQLPIFWLNDSASSNIPLMLLTFAISQAR